MLATNLNVWLIQRTLIFETSFYSSSSSSSNPSSPLSSPPSSSSSWIHLRSALFVVASSSPASCSSSDRARLKSPWSRRKRKRPLRPQQRKRFFMPDGRLRNGGVDLLKKVRSRGIEPSIRFEVWPFLLGVYGFNSSKEERVTIRTRRRKEYERLRRQCKRFQKHNNGTLKVNRVSDTMQDEYDWPQVQDSDSACSDEVVSARESLSSNEDIGYMSEVSCTVERDGSSSRRITNATISTKMNRTVQIIHESGLRRWSEEMLRRELLGCCKVYISEARNRTALEAVERAAKSFPPAAIVNKFEDAAYGRVGYTLVSTLAHEASGSSSSSSSPLKDAVFAMVKTALDTISLELHSGSHPRLGVVDHICFHPLSQTSIDQVSAVATSLALDIGSILRVPTYLYGAAHEEQCTLDSIRRKLGYFKANREGHEWAGGLELEVVPVKPDAGPQEVSKAKGVVAVGACGWVSNYNVPVMSTDLKAVRRIARKASERGGGLASVQTMALVHGSGVIEVACNLLNPSQVGGDDVQGLIERLGREEGLLVGKGYYTDYTADQITQRYKDLLINS